MPEQEPIIRLNMSGETFEATRRNTRLFTFLGKHAMYNHIFFQTEPENENGNVVGSYLFSVSPVFNDIASFMFEQEYPMRLNELEAPQCDIDAYETMVAQNLADLDHVPDEWLDDGSES